MPISWKKRPALKPEIILSRIQAVRNVDSNDKVFFRGFDLHELLPVLQSMLEFPLAANIVEPSTLVWKTVANMTGDLTPKAFIASINSTLSKEISTKETEYYILTSISINSIGLPNRIIQGDGTIFVRHRDYPKKYAKPREDAIRKRKQQIEIDDTPSNYTKLIIKVISKSPYGAMTNALNVLDTQRAIWCLLSNHSMELIGNPINPINVIRTGGIHTIHYKDGTIASDNVWYEPNFSKATLFTSKDTELLNKDSKYAFRNLRQSKYNKDIRNSLLRYVRALDEKDQNTAFLKLWGALETLASPNLANYEKLIKRCSFLFKDHEYHQQILEHLREYRNQSIHSGDQVDNAKTHCYQLQQYYYQLVWFHLRNASFFRTLDETNEFLEFTVNIDSLKRSKRLILKALKFIHPCVTHTTI